MLECFEVQHAAEVKQPADLQLVLCYQERQRSRFRATSLCGREVGWFVTRGEVLADGDMLVAKTGERIAIVAAEETVSEVKTGDAHLLARAAYHLGNRHVPLQILPGVLRYQHDHVLDEMLQGLGLTVQVTDKPFHPENGAYHGSGHSHEPEKNSHEPEKNSHERGKNSLEPSDNSHTPSDNSHEHHHHG